MHLCIPVVVAVAIAAPAADDTRTRFEQLAGRLQFFPTHEFAYGRGDQLDPRFPKKGIDAWLKVFAALSEKKPDTSELVGLLKHKDPKVRTLALAALYQQDDARVLPHLAALMDDRETTAPEPVVLGAGLSVQDRVPAADVHKQSVGTVATVLVAYWLEPAGYKAQDFAGYWAARKDRRFCASWFLVRLHRAGQARSPFDDRRAPLIRTVRKDVDALPVVDRDWTLLWAAAHHGQALGAEAVRHFATPEERLTAAERLGPARLMALIKGQDISTDPDLAANDRRSRGRDDLILWVLRHARKLLRPGDAPAVLAAGNDLRDRPPECAVAAAELQPENARRWLREAFGRYPGNGYSAGYRRAVLAAGLWRVVGESEVDYLADWFYGETVDKHPHTPQTAMFLQAVRAERAPADRALLARLVTDPRLDQLDYQSLRAVAEVVNGWTKAPVIPPAELYPNWRNGTWGPEAPADFKILAGWRDRLKSSTTEWKPRPRE